MDAQLRTKAREAGSDRHVQDEREASRAGVAIESRACAVCGQGASDVVCSADQVRRQLDWVKRFHVRRLKPGRSGKPPRSALEDRADFTQSFATNVVACRDCGLVYRDPRPTSEAIEAIYVRDRYGEARLEALADSQHELYVPKVAVLRRWLPAGADVHVLELGSFVGGFLIAALTEQWDVRGIDPGEEVTAFCQERGLPVLRGTLEEADVPKGSIDCVAVWNTFDQLPDPASTLAAIRRVLRPRGILAVRVPNGLFFRSSMARLRHSRLAGPLRSVLAWNNLLGFPYLYGYSIPTLDRLLARYDLARIAAHPDTLVRLSDRATRRWAELEERVAKLACRAAWTCARGGRRRDYVAAPWLDVYYRLAE
jgi:SAM-dependent methyltransferase